MAGGDEERSAEQQVGRSVNRLIGNLILILVVVAAAAGWGYFGSYQLGPGQAAIIFRVGRYVETVAEPGLHFHWPPPFETVEIVNASEMSREEFGVLEEGGAAENRAAELEASMQTGDNNIVSLGFVVQYRVSDAFESRYRVADPVPTLRDAAQAAVREVVGRMTVDAVLTELRGEVERDGRRILQEILDSYEMGIAIVEVKLQEVQPPEEVRAAFDDVVAAAQDASLLVNQAQGHRNEVLPRARAEAGELVEEAMGYRDSKLAEAQGKADRFVALLEEYQKAPKVTKQRLYLETMEDVLADVEKVIVEPGTASVLPYFPLESRPRGAKP